MRRLRLLPVAFAVVTAVGGGCTKTPNEERAGRGVAVGTGGAAADVRGDAEFVQDVAAMNLAEIELSRMALGRVSHPDIKSFAQRIIEEHDAAGSKLKTVASGHSIRWPDQLAGEHRERADELASAQGADFDRGYIEAMIEHHQNLTARLESRLDVESIARWKAAAAGRTRSQALPEPDLEMPDVQLRPNESGDELTMNINRWAAETYPIAQKHLDMARMLENASKRRSTD
jgi:putative membrane protein